MAAQRYLYVIKEQNSDWLKVGIAADVNGRLKELQVGNPDPLEVVLAIPVARPVAAENLAHKLLEDYRGLGEWFNAPLDVAKQAVIQAAVSTCDVERGVYSQEEFEKAEQVVFLMETLDMDKSPAIHLVFEAFSGRAYSRATRLVEALIAQRRAMAPAA